MPLHQLQKVEKVRSHEAIFLDHYSWLLDRALRLTNGSKEASEDLVQDLYVRFVQSQANLDLDDEDRLRGYLFTALNNLANSNYHQSRRDPLTDLRAVDYDSMEFALAAVDRSQLLHVRSDLASICAYACIRRKTSRAGSVLILRYFLEYYPPEIVALLKTSRAAVHKLIETARLEARAFLERPEALHFLGSEPTAIIPFSKQYLPDDPAVLFSELRRRVLAEPLGICPDPAELDQRYARGSDRPLAMQEVAHLVSCRSCLERSNRLLHLPSLPERFSDEFNGHQNDKNHPPSSGGSSSDPLRKLRKRLRDTHEHRPKKLQIAINGEVRGAQQVTSARSYFQIKLKPSSRPKFIEVLSEQGVRLLYLGVEQRDFAEPTAGRTDIELSDNRSLSVELTLNGITPVVNVSYHDPLLDEIDDECIHETERAPLPMRSEETAEKTLQPYRFFSRLGENLRNWLFRDHLRWALSFGLAAGAAGLFVLLSLSHGPTQQKEPPVPTASSLLSRSESLSASAIPDHGAARQRFALEIRNGSGKLLKTATVETLRGRAPVRSAARLLSSDGKVLAGRWSDPQGNATTYALQDGLRHSREATEADVSFANAWTHLPEATGFSELTGGRAEVAEKRPDGSYEIAYSAPAQDKQPRLVFADLVLSRDNLRAVQETIRLRQGAETREYQFREITYEVLSASQVRDEDFEPLPAMASLRPGRAEGNDVNAAHVALEALQLLSNLGPDVERVVNLERTADGSVELNGVFPTSDQKRSLTQLFHSLQGGNRLRLDLHAQDESTSSDSSPHSPHNVSIESLPIDEQHVPFDSTLRSALTRKGLQGAELEGRMREIASKIVAEGADLHRKSWNINQIAAHDFSLVELQKMSPEDKMLWLTLLGKHLHSYDQSLHSLRTTLATIEPDAQNSTTAQALTFRNTADFSQAVDMIAADSGRLDRLLAQGFTLSPSDAPATGSLAMTTQLLDNLEAVDHALLNTVARLETSGLAETR